MMFSLYNNNMSNREFYHGILNINLLGEYGETRSMLLANLSVTSAGGQYQTTKHKYKIIADNVSLSQVLSYGKMLLVQKAKLLFVQSTTSNIM
ncbi:hypothetical protein YC2023_120128 [Brassica napus]